MEDSQRLPDEIKRSKLHPPISNSVLTRQTERHLPPPQHSVSPSHPKKPGRGVQDGRVRGSCAASPAVPKARQVVRHRLLEPGEQAAQPRGGHLPRCKLAAAGILLGASVSEHQALLLGRKSDNA